MNENFLINIGLGYTAKTTVSSLVDQIDAILPHTPCTQCDFEGCRPYAESLANGDAKINQCHPGGQEEIDALSDLHVVEVLL